MRLCTEHAYSGETGGNKSDNSVSSTGCSSMPADDGVCDRAACEEKSGEGKGNHAGRRDSHDGAVKQDTSASCSDLYNPSDSILAKAVCWIRPFERYP